MQRRIFFGWFVLTCLISCIYAASLSIPSLTTNRHLSNQQQQPYSHSIDSNSILSNLRSNDFAKRSDKDLADQDVLDLENLKHPDNTVTVENQGEKVASLERLLAAAAAAAAASTTNSVQNEREEIPQDVEKHLLENNMLKTSINDGRHFDNININLNNDRTHSTQPKLYHGAARLAFGQNPEIVSSPSTSTPNTPAKIATEMPVTTAMTTSSSELTLSNSYLSVDHESTPPMEIPNNGKRHGTGNMNVAKNAEYLFRHSGGQYSALDMAQYVFWTGDEEGVAKAVEEFIRKGLMSRENAIKFLRDISMGIDYLENAYSANRQIDAVEDRQGYQQIVPTKTPTTTTTTTTTTPKPIILVEKSVLPPLGEIPSPLMKLNEIPNDITKEHSVNFDENSGRLRLADFLYAEYSLEEVIYQLAKVIFTQSLSKDSEEAQIVLQRLTNFLEAEGANGRISPALQKKVLDVLLVALSDCLAENPQLLAAARLSLANTASQLPKQPDKN